MAFLTINGTAVPCPVSLSVGNEIIWSANTGRTDSGQMVGDVIAEKMTLSINWGVLTDAEYKRIKDNIRAGFFTVKFHEACEDVTIRAYRGTLTGEQLGYVGDGTFYYRSASCQIIQQ